MHKIAAQVNAALKNDDGMSTIEYSIVKLLYPRRCETAQAV